MRDRVLLILLITLPASGGAWYAATLAGPHLFSPGDHPPGSGLVAEGGPVAEVEHNARTGSVEHVFRLTNRGAVPLEVERIGTGCACTAAEAVAGPIHPNESRDLRVRVTAFPVDEAVTTQEITVVLAGGQPPLNLKFKVRLPLPERTLFRPDVVYLMPQAGEARVTRTVGVRVPKHRGVMLTTQDVVKVGCEGLEVSLAELSPTDMFREYRLTVTGPAAPAHVGAKLRISTGCDVIEIPVYFMGS